MRLLLLILVLTGCGTTSRAVVETVQETRTSAKTVTQEIAPNGDIVQLASTTTTFTTTDTDTKSTEYVEVEPPKIVGSIAGIIKAAVASSAGPAAPLVAAGIDWFTTLLTGGSTLAVASGAGALALRKQQNEKATAERQRDEIIKGIERAKADLVSSKVTTAAGPDGDAWALLVAALEAEQSKDTQLLARAKTA